MKPQLIFFIFVTNLLSFGSGAFLRLYEDNNSDSYLKTLQIIKKYGYPAEAHVVETDDGYLLEIHRIPHGKDDAPSPGRPPILLVHSFVGSSADYFVAGADKCLPFLLADQGFDVWLANFRGNSYSRGHKILTPDVKEFWDFTWHESGVYDLPAHIDFITNFTKVGKISYLGYSINAVTYFALTSTRPEYQEKIKGVILLAPVVYMKQLTHAQRHVTRFAPYSSELQILSEKVLGGKLLGQTFPYRFITRHVCTLTELEKNVCRNLILSLFNNDHGQFNESIVPALLNHYPSGYSTKGLAHFGQTIESGKFRQYDYGPDGNLKKYGCDVPPEYNLNGVVTPIYVFYGLNDNLVTLTDLTYLNQKVKSIKKIIAVDNIHFNHLDFILGNDVRKLLHEKVLERLAQL